jgi:hypothetical protein
MFPLTRGEIMNLSQIVISSKIKHAPNVFAFTEQGVAMLSSIPEHEPWEWHFFLTFPADSVYFEMKPYPCQ